MKTPLTAYLPALALFALSGCAGTTALTTSENDGVYYSSADRTTAVATAPRYAASGYNSSAPAAPNAPAASVGEAANPDYTGNTTATGTTGSDQYYNDAAAGGTGYDPNASLFNQPYTGPGMGGYMPNSPYTSLSYGGVDPYGYGGFGYSPYSAFASPFYSPFGFGYGSGLSIGLGFGRPFGYGYGGGYGGYGYDPFYSPYSPFGYGGYGYGAGYYGGYGAGYYGGGYGGGRNVIYTGNGGTRYDNGGGNTVRVGPRETRAGAAYGRNGMVNGAVAPAGLAGSNNSATAGGRGRLGTNAINAPVTPDLQSPAMTTGRANTEALDRPTGAQPAYGNATDVGAGRGRMRNMDQPAMAGGNQPQQMQSAMPQGQAGQPRRGGFFREMFTSPSTGQPMPQQQVNNGGGMQSGNYNQPRPRMAEQPQRSYEQPQRSEQRSFSQPSYNSGSRGGGGFGGGNSGGGGGGGGRSGGRGRM